MIKYFQTFKPVLKKTITDFVISQNDFCRVLKELQLIFCGTIIEMLNEIKQKIYVKLALNVKQVEAKRAESKT